MLNLQHLHQQIKNKLFEIAYITECFNKAGDNDISRYAEIYFKNIFNIIYKKNSLHFEKAEKINQDTYDLHDKENCECIQITSNKKQSKKDTTIESFIKNNHIVNFKKLTILFISKTKPRKNNIKIEGFEYKDLNIIELAGLIESCSQTELLEIRDILMSNMDFIHHSKQSNKITSVSNSDTELSAKEFIRCRELEKELKKEFLKPLFYQNQTPQQVLNSIRNPFDKLTFPDIIQHSITDKTYPEVTDDSKWRRTYIYDFYTRGILIWIDAGVGTTATLNKKGNWRIEQDRNLLPSKNFKIINIRIIGKLPYENIVNWADGDEYYRQHHIYCKYSSEYGDSPYEKIMYLYEDENGDWQHLDIKKQLKT